MANRGHAYSVLKEDGSNASPLMMPRYHQQAPPITTMSSNNTNVVELQPMGGQQPYTVQMPKPQANDHLWLTLALIFLCFMLGFNVMGVVLLLPGLLCASVAADYNKEGNVERARSCGSMAFVYDMIIVLLHIGAYVLGFVSVIVSIAIIYTKTRETISGVVDTANGINDNVQQYFTPAPL